MKTSQEWWNEVKNDTEKLVDWLQKQYRGEVTAANRIMKIVSEYAVTVKASKILNAIATQEMTHGIWLMQLLEDRMIPIPSTLNAEDRYWNQVKDAMEDFETTCAVGAHAEKMRLDRIQVIVNDPDTPDDIRLVFQKILPEEQFHARAFAELAGEDAIARTKGNHENGLNVLGLII